MRLKHRSIADRSCKTDRMPYPFPLLPRKKRRTDWERGKARGLKEKRNRTKEEARIGRAEEKKGEK